MSWGANSCPSSPARSVNSAGRCNSSRSVHDDLSLRACRLRCAELEDILKQERQDRKKTETKAVDYLKHIKDDYDRQLSEKDKEIARLKRQLLKSKSTDQLDSEIQARDAEIEKLKDRCKYTREINVDLREKNKMLEDQINANNEKLEKELEMKKEELEKRIKESNQLKEICAELESQMDQYDSLLTQKTQAFVQVSIEKSNLEAENKSLRHELDSLRTDLVDVLHDKDRKIEDLTAQLGQLEAVITAEKARTKSLVKQVEEFEKVGQASVNRIAALEEALNHANAENCASEDRIQELEADNMKIKEEAANHISELQAQKSELTCLKYKLQDTLRVVDDLKSKLDEKTKEIENEKYQWETEIFRLTERLRQHFDLEHTMMDKIERLERAKKPIIAFSPNPRKFFRNNKIFEGEESEQTRKLQEELIKAEAELLDVKSELKAVTQMNGVSGREERSRFRNPSAPAPDFEDADPGTYEESRVSTDENDFSALRGTNLSYLLPSRQSYSLHQQFAVMNSVIDELDRRREKDSQIFTQKA